jgi:hypothetical protein
VLLPSDSNTVRIRSSTRWSYGDSNRRPLACHAKLAARNSVGRRSEFGLQAAMIRFWKAVGGRARVCMVGPIWTTGGTRWDQDHAQGHPMFDRSNTLGEHASGWRQQASTRAAHGSSDLTSRGSGWSVPDSWLSPHVNGNAFRRSCHPAPAGRWRTISLLRADRNVVASDPRPARWPGRAADTTAPADRQGSLRGASGLRLIRAGAD